LRALEFQYGLLDYMKSSQVFTEESIQREVTYLQSPGRLLAPEDEKESPDRKASILKLMLSINVNKKHREELWAILNKTSQGHLAEYLSGYECKLLI